MRFVATSWVTLIVMRPVPNRALIVVERVIIHLFGVGTSPPVGAAT